MASLSKKVFITGIDGFTGKYLESFLQRKGYEVFGTVLGETDSKNYFTCDIRKSSDIQDVIATVQPDYILHLAAISFVGESDSSLIYDVNVMGTQNLLDAVIHSGLNPDKIIIASSATVYGNQGKEVLDESMCPMPVNHYGISKLAMEHMVSTYFDKLNIIMTRPFNYTGAGQAEHFLIPKIVKHYQEKAEIIELGNLNVAREFNDIRDIVNIYEQLLSCSSKSIIVNLCSGNAVSLMEIIESMNEIAGYKIRVDINPAFVRENEIKLLIGSSVNLSSVINLNFKYDIHNMLMSMYAE